MGQQGPWALQEIAIKLSETFESIEGVYVLLKYKMEYLVGWFAWPRPPSDMVK